MNRELGSSFHCVFCIRYLSAWTCMQRICDEGDEPGATQAGAALPTPVSFRRARECSYRWLAAQGLEEPSVVPPQEVKVSLGQLLHATHQWLVGGGGRWQGGAAYKVAENGVAHGP